MRVEGLGDRAVEVGIKINEKNSALFWRYSGAIAYLKSERYAMHILLAMTLIMLLAALCALFS
jgi:hypothetical protein